MNRPTSSPRPPVALDLERGEDLVAALRRAAGTLADLGRAVAGVEREAGGARGPAGPAAVLAGAARRLDGAAADVAGRLADLAAAELAGHALGAVHARGGAVSAEAAVRELVTGLSEEAAWHLAVAHPTLVAANPGLGLPLRSQANHSITVWEAALPDPGRPGWSADLDPLPDDLQLLALDPDAGTATIVVGDLDAAAHVVVWVPGTATTVADLVADSDDLERLRAEAEVVARLCSDRAGAVAVVGWLGYDPPDHVVAAAIGDAGAPARDGAPVLVALARELRADPAADGRAPHVTVVGHSYGSLVVGEAVRGGLAVDDVAVVGSAGVGRGVRFPSATAVWVGHADGDPIALAHLADRVVAFLDPLTPFDAVVDSADVYGRDPVAAGLGTRFATTGAHGHSGYLDTGTASLANLAAIAAGSPTAVTRDP